MPLMDEETKRMLRDNGVKLVELIDLNAALWIELTSRSVVTKTQKEHIICNDRNTATEQKTKLLDLLPRRGQEKFVQFCLALVTTEQETIVTDVMGLNLDNLKKSCDIEMQNAGGDNVTSCPSTIGTDAPTLTSALGGSGSIPPKRSVEDIKLKHESDSSVKKMRIGEPHETESDDGIDLTDAWSVQPVPVATSTQDFYNSHHDHSLVYPMYLQVRGHCLIINVTGTGDDMRRGTEVDNIHLIHLFSELHFEVHSLSDNDGLTAMNIYEKVKAFFAMPDHANCNCAALCILSHGDCSTVYGTDNNRVPLDELYRLMNNCPGLENKPKLVFLESCSGLHYDDGKTTLTTLCGEDQSDAPSKIPNMADFFIGRPSQPGMRAHRNTKLGSWYVQAIVKVFSKFSATLSLPELIFKVNAAVAKKESKCSDPLKAGKKQMPDQRLNLRRNLYFFPGIQRTHP